MRFNHAVSSEFVAVVGLGAAVGLLVGVAISGAVFVAGASDLSSKLQEKSAQVVALKAMLETSVDFAALEGSSDEGPRAPVLVSRPAEKASPPVTANPRPAPPAAKQAERPAAEVAARRTSESSLKPETPAPSSVPVPDVVSADEVAAVVSGARIEGVSAKKARVARLSTEGVYLSSGALIRPGERFASGERLLKVDPENNRVVTSDRQLLLFFGD